MRIIKEGSKIVKRVTCEYCESKLEYDNSDISIDLLSMYLTPTLVQYKITCPVCNETIFVPYLPKFDPNKKIEDKFVAMYRGEIIE